MPPSSTRRKSRTHLGPVPRPRKAQNLVDTRDRVAGADGARLVVGEVVVKKRPDLLLDGLPHVEQREDERAAPVLGERALLEVTTLRARREARISMASLKRRDIGAKAKRSSRTHLGDPRCHLIRDPEPLKYGVHLAVQRPEEVTQRLDAARERVGLARAQAQERGDAIGRPGAGRRRGRACR